MKTTIYCTLFIFLLAKFNVFVIIVLVIFLQMNLYLYVPTTYVHRNIKTSTTKIFRKKNIKQIILTHANKSEQLPDNNNIC